MELKKTNMRVGQELICIKYRDSININYSYVVSHVTPAGINIINDNGRNVFFFFNKFPHIDVFFITKREINLKLILDNNESRT